MPKTSHPKCIAFQLGCLTCPSRVRFEARGLDTLDPERIANRGLRRQAQQLADIVNNVDASTVATPGSSSYISSDHCYGHEPCPIVEQIEAATDALNETFFVDLKIK